MTTTAITTATTPAVVTVPAVATTERARRAAPVRRRRAAAAPDAPLRLTRRGRAVVVLLLLAGLLLLGFTIGRASQSHAAGATRTATVQPGDTLWSIAARTAPDRDTRQVVAAIRAANHLATASLQVGQQLVVPA